jgi:hypothetical protein
MCGVEELALAISMVVRFLANKEDVSGADGFPSAPIFRYLVRAQEYLLVQVRYFLYIGLLISEHYSGCLQSHTSKDCFR